MKAALISLLLAGANAHTIFQRMSVNGADKGQLVGVRAPQNDNPVMDVNSASIACNTGLINPVSSTVIEVPAGGKVGALWGHVIGGAQRAGDPDQPIAKSHKGPIMAYLAKVDNAGTASPNGLKWFKIFEDGLDSSGTWGVDRMISNNGWTYFTMPTCVAPGDYLMRVELIALHSAGKQGQAQFYMSCANIKVTGSGTQTGQTVSFPGAYKATDPGILVNIYNNAGQPNGGGRPYTIPGPPAMKC